MKCRTTETGTETVADEMIGIGTETETGTGTAAIKTEIVTETEAGAEILRCWAFWIYFLAHSICETSSISFSLIRFALAVCC